MNPAQPHCTITERSRIQRHEDFLRWQHAKVMCMLFGGGYVVIPPLPPGYEVYSQWWYDNQLKAVR